MKIYITKPCPHTYVSRGFQYCTVWLGAKPIRTGVHVRDKNGTILPRMEWSSGQWKEGEGSLGYMNAKIFFKGKEHTPLWKDMLDKLINSYKVNYNDFQGREQAYYSAISDAFMAGLPDGKFSSADISNELNQLLGTEDNKQSDDDLLEDFLRMISIDMIAFKNVEKEGMLNTEWIIEYDIDVHISESKDDQNNAWLTKNYSERHCDIWLGKKYPPVFREAMIIDPAFKSVLCKDSRTSAEFNGDAHSEKFNVVSVIPLLNTELNKLILPTYNIASLSDLMPTYEQAKDAFYQQHLALAQAVKTEDDVIALYHNPLFTDVNAIDLCGNEFDGASFGDFTPNDLAIMLLTVMAENHARQSVDTKEFAFKDYVKPISLDFIWNGHVC